MPQPEKGRKGGKFLKKFSFYPLPPFSGRGKGESRGDAEASPLFL